MGRVDLLKDFSLTIPGGKVTDLIGKSGCGKSTLAKLIASLYSLQSGNIRIGIYNLQDLVGEAEVLDKLLFYRQGKTTIMISHHPRVINRADWIVLLENGELKLTGTPDELRQMEGNPLNFLTP